MNELVDFLLARIDEDEAYLSAAHIPEQYADDFAYGGTDDYYQITMGLGRARAECAAKRAIVALFDPEDAAPDSDRDLAFYAGGVGDCIQALVAIYKDHPDYQQEWALKGAGDE